MIIHFDLLVSQMHYYNRKKRQKENEKKKHVLLLFVLLKQSAKEGNVEIGETKCKVIETNN